MQSEAKRKYREKNKDILNAKNREYYYRTIKHQKERSRLYRQTHLEGENERSKRWVRNNPEKAMLMRAKERAKRKGLEFNITLKDIIIPKFCPILGLLLYVSVGRQTDNSPSLDRINNDKGYISGNVIVVSHRVNHIKNNATPDELIKIGLFFKNFEKKEKIPSYMKEWY